MKKEKLQEEEKKGEAMAENSPGKKLQDAMERLGLLTDEAEGIKDEKKKSEIINMIDRRCKKLKPFDREAKGEKTSILLADFGALIFELEEKLEESKKSPGGKEEKKGEDENKEQKKLTRAEFEDKYKNIFKRNLFQDETKKFWMYVRDYNEGTGLVSVAYTPGMKGMKNKCTLAELDNKIKIFPIVEEKKREERKSENKRARTITQRDEDIFKTAAGSNGDKRVYNYASTPEDAREKAKEIKDIKEGKQKELNKKAGENIDGAGEKFDLTTPEGRQAEINSKFSEEKKEERAQKIEMSRIEMEKARKDYLETDYKKKKAHHRLFRFFGSLGKSGRDLEKDEEMAYYEGIYQNKLFDYKNALVNDAKERGVSNKELGEIVKIFAIEKEINLADAQIDVKAEHQEGIITGLKDLIDKYRKLSLPKKIAIGAVFGLAGFGGAYAGATAAGAIGGAVAIRRAFLGAVTGTGISILMESRDAKKREKSTETEAGGFVKILEGLGEEERFERTLQRINELNKNSDKNLSKIKNKNLFNLSAGVLAGTILGSGVLAELGKNWHQAGEYYQKAKEYAGWHGDGYSLKVPSLNGHMEQSAINSPDSVGTVSSAKNFENLSVIKGGSIEGTLIKHLEEQGIKHAEAGSEAHKLVTAYAEEKGIPLEKFNHVLPGQEVKINPDGTIRNIPGFEKFSEAISPGEAVEHAPAGTGGEMPEQADNFEPEGQASIETPVVENAFNRDIDSVLGDLNGQIEENAQELDRNYVHTPEQLNAFEERISDLGYSREFLSQFKESILSGNQNRAARSFQKTISLGEDWDKIKGMSFKEAVARMNWRASGKLESAFRSLKNIVGDNVRPENGETLETWTKRVVKLAVEKTNEK